jgi:hypothetical protein
MRYLHLLPLVVLLAGCAHTRGTGASYDAIARYLTPQLIDRHLMNGSEPSPTPDVRNEDGKLLTDFGGRCLITIGRGNSFFTEADYKKMRGGFFASILGAELLCPKIGRRAYIAGIEQDIALFTTTDGRFDIRIEPRGTPQPVDVVGVASELSELYDRGANKRAAGKGGIRALSQAECARPALPEHNRYAGASTRR